MVHIYDRWMMPGIDSYRPRDYDVFQADADREESCKENSCDAEAESEVFVDAVAEVAVIADEVPVIADEVAVDADISSEERPPPRTFYDRWVSPIVRGFSIAREIVSFIFAPFTA